MDSMDVYKYERDVARQWRFLEKVSDLPGGCRPAEINPIIIEIQRDSKSPIVRKRLRAQGFIDSEEKFAYVLKKSLERALYDEVGATDTVFAVVNSDV